MSAAFFSTRTFFAVDLTSAPFNFGLPLASALDERPPCAEPCTEKDFKRAAEEMEMKACGVRTRIGLWRLPLV